MKSANYIGKRKNREIRINNSCQSTDCLFARFSSEVPNTSCYNVNLR
ncbi:MAG: hypothetical protein JXQ23_05770 [Clostridia bacterium]|nr:hypothetical protein [Clostridia bacterium]